MGSTADGGSVGALWVSGAAGNAMRTSTGIKLQQKPLSLFLRFADRQASQTATGASSCHVHETPQYCCDAKCFSATLFTRIAHKTLRDHTTDTSQIVQPSFNVLCLGASCTHLTGNS